MHRDWEEALYIAAKATFVILTSLSQGDPFSTRAFVCTLPEYNPSNGYFTISMEGNGLKSEVLLKHEYFIGL